MEEVWTVFQSVLETKNEYLGIYLKELDEHSSSEKKGADWVVQHISSALSRSRTSNEGLVVLNCYLKQATLAVLEQKTGLWTTLTLKILNSKRNDINFDLVYSTLSLLASNSTRSSDISKYFASNQLSQIYESLSSVIPRGYLAALKCMEMCLRLYPGPSGPFRNCVERFVLKLIDTMDADINLWSGKCFHLLQQVRGGGTQGVGHKMSWLKYQERLLEALHSVLDLAFSHCNELYGISKEEKDDHGIPQLQVSDEPTKRAAQISVRLHNLVNYLISALRDPFPVAKTVKPKKILNLICRGLSVTCPILEKNPISDNLALGVLLPKMHKNLLELLKTLIITLRSNLKPHHLTILGLLVDTLNWTRYKKCIGLKKPVSNLRSKAYEVLELWCTTLQNGSRIELFAETLIEQVFLDISPFQNECTLKVLNGAKKHMSKKARRQLLKAQNEKSNLSQSHSNDHSYQKDNSTAEKNCGLCVSALKCLQYILTSAASFLKPTLIKMIHIKVIQICAVFYELPMHRRQLYYDWECRLEIYKVVHLLITHPHHLCPPPTQMVLHILKTAQVYERNGRVQQQCAQVLWYMENIIHPRKEGLLFPVDIRDIRKDFLKFGKESLLSSGIFAVSNNDGSTNGGTDEESLDHSTDKRKTEEFASQLTLGAVNSSADSVEIVNIRNSPSDEINAGNEDSMEALKGVTCHNESNANLKEVNIEEQFDVEVSSEPMSKKQRLEIHKVEDEKEEEEHTVARDVNDKSIIQTSSDGTNADSVTDTSDNTIHNTNTELIDHGSSDMINGKTYEETVTYSAPMEKNISTDDDIYADIEAAFVDELN